MNEELREKVLAELAKLPDGKTDTERRLAEAIYYICANDFRAVWQLERLNANNQIENE